MIRVLSRSGFLVPLAQWGITGQHMFGTKSTMTVCVVDLATGVITLCACCHSWENLVRLSVLLHISQMLFSLQSPENKNRAD